ncbi:Peptidase M2 domain containing protein, partial [Asbolus verrucosus]
MGEEEKQNWQKVRKFNWKYFSDYDLRRQFYKYSNLGSSVLSEEKLKKLSALISDMQEIYSTAKICAFDDPKNCNLTLEPELTNIFANSRNPDELTHAWINWRKAVGPRCKNLFKEYVELSNEAARLNNFKDAGEEWLENYEDSQIKQQFKALWQQVKPLYLQIHAYVRFHLRKKYGDIVSKDGPIPAHLLGFHEAIGDLISLSVQSRKHLRKLGLLKSNKNDSEEVLNSLFMIGLDKIVYLPFAYLLDLWRWEVFAGKVTPNNYNHKWWKLREKYQGIAPPVSRSEADFDPAAKYHTIGSVPYIRYFVSVIIQFQFHQALCKLAGEYVPNDPSKPLHKCDIYQNTDAGNAL